MFLSSEYHRTICLVMIFLLLFLFYTFYGFSILYFLWVFYFILFYEFSILYFLWAFLIFILLCNLAFPITLRLFAHSGLVSGFYIFHFWLRWGFVLECPGEVLGLILQIKCGFFKNKFSPKWCGAWGVNKAIKNKSKLV